MTKIKEKETRPQIRDMTLERRPNCNSVRFGRNGFTKSSTIIAGSEFKALETVLLGIEGVLLHVLVRIIASASYTGRLT